MAACLLCPRDPGVWVGGYCGWVGVPPLCTLSVLLCGLAGLMSWGGGSMASFHLCTDKCENTVGVTLIERVCLLQSSFLQHHSDGRVDLQLLMFPAV